MNYTTEDAISLTIRLRQDLERHGPDHVFTQLSEQAPELLALTLILTTMSR